MSTKNKKNEAKWAFELAKRVKAGRNDDSQAELAKRSGVSDRTIGLIESRMLERPPRQSTIARLAYATNDDPYEWIQSVDLPPDRFEIEKVRDSVNAKIHSNQLKPADVIKEEMLAEIGVATARLTEHIKNAVAAAVADFKPADELKSEIQLEIRGQIHASVMEEVQRDFDLHKEEFEKKVAGFVGQQIRKELEGLEPADKIKAHVHEQLKAELSVLEPATRIKNEIEKSLTDIINMKFDMTKRLIEDLITRLNNLADAQADLAARLSQADSGGRKRPASARSGHQPSRRGDA